MYATLPFNYIYIYKLIGVRKFAAYSNLLPIWHNLLINSYDDIPIYFAVAVNETIILYSLNLSEIL